jgi:hypothetical protein
MVFLASLSFPELWKRAAFQLWQLWQLEAGFLPLYRLWQVIERQFRVTGSSSQLASPKEPDTVRDEHAVFNCTAINVSAVDNMSASSRYQP